MQPYLRMKSVLIGHVWTILFLHSYAFLVMAHSVHDLPSELAYSRFLVKLGSYNLAIQWSVQCLCTYMLDPVMKSMFLMGA